MITLQDPMSGRPFHVVHATTDLSNLPVRWDTITKNISQNKYGTIVISYDNEPIIFYKTTIDAVLKAAASQNLLSEADISYEQDLIHELVITVNLGHSYVDLQYNDPIHTWFTKFSFYPGTRIELDEEAGFFSTAKAYLGFQHKQSCHFNNLKCFEGSWHGGKSFESVKNNHPSINHIESVYSSQFQVIFKVTEEQFNSALVVTQDVFNSCKSKDKKFLFNTMTDEKNNQYNCITSIELITKAAGIEHSYLMYTPDSFLYESSYSRGLDDHYWVLYKNRENLNMFEGMQLQLMKSAHVFIVDYVMPSAKLMGVLLFPFMYAYNIFTGDKDSTSVSHVSDETSDFILAECKNSENENLHPCILPFHLASEGTPNMFSGEVELLVNLTIGKDGNYIYTKQYTDEYFVTTCFIGKESPLDKIFADFDSSACSALGCTAINSTNSEECIV